MAAMTNRSMNFTTANLNKLCVFKFHPSNLSRNELSFHIGNLLIINLEMSLNLSKLFYLREEVFIALSAELLFLNVNQT